MRTKHRGPRRSFRKIRVVDAHKLRTTVAGTAIGNFMEWYDYGVYGFLATTIAAVFFPQGSGYALLATFAVLTISFAVRPIGGIIFGVLADKVGRKRILMITITLMAAGTTAIGVLPGYATIGIWALILLIICRLVQGFSTGGEYVDAMVYINEHAPDRRRGFWASFLPVGTLSGYVAGAALATLLTAVLSNDQMTTWGWRIPFLLAAPIGLVGLYIRLRLEESPVFQEQEEQRLAETARRHPHYTGLAHFRRTVISQWRPLLIVIGLVMLVNVATYMLTYLPSYLKAIVGIGDTTALMLVLIVLLILVATVSASARLSDRIGRRPMMFTGCVLLFVAAIPAFLLIQTSTWILVFFGVLLVGLMLLFFTAVEPATLPGMFPTEMRGSGVSIGYNISVTAFGGTTPLIAQGLISATGNELMPAFYLMLAAVVGVFAVYLTREPAGRPLPGTRPAAESHEEAREMAGLDSEPGDSGPPEESARSGTPT